MTARERAEETVRKMDAAHAFEPEEEDVRFIAEAILAAEAAAYERAAEHVAGYEDGGGWHNALAAEVRSLATKGGDRG